MLRVTASLFADVRDNRPNMATATWAEFVDCLAGAASEPAEPAEKLTTVCFSPAQYAPGVTRGLGALAWDWAGVDLDDKTGHGWRFEEVAAYLDGLDLAHVVYTTTSSTAERHCLRAFVPLSRSVAASEFQAFWYALNQMFGAVVDAQTKDVSRLFVEPRAWVGAENRFSARHEGVALDPDELMCRHPAPPPQPEPSAEIITAMLQRPRRQPTQPDFWTLVDLDRSPIVPRAALAKALGSARGGRMISFLVSCAMSALARGYDVNEAELLALGQALAHRLGRARGDIRHDARSALRMAAARVAAGSTERMRSQQHALFGRR